jgi:hypothetical protein
VLLNVVAAVWYQQTYAWRLSSFFFFFFSQYLLSLAGRLIILLVGIIMVMLMIIRNFVYAREKITCMLVKKEEAEIE